jgi:MFS family permease
VVNKISPSGILLWSAIFSFVGLIWLSYAQGYMAFAAAGVFAVGVCYFWPTIYGFVSENIPKSGALGLSVIGGAGMFSVSLILPVIGQVYDWRSSIVNNQSQAGADTLRYVAILAGILIVCFIGLNIYMKKEKYPDNKE